MAGETPPEDDGTPVAGDGTTLALGRSGVQFYSVAHTTPARIIGAAMSGLTATKPRAHLRLTVAAGRGAPALKSLRVLVPRRLGGGAKPKTIALKTSKRRAMVTLRRLRPDATLRRVAIRGGRTTLTVPVELLDTAGHTSLSRVTLEVTR